MELHPYAHERIYPRGDDNNPYKRTQNNAVHSGEKTVEKPEMPPEINKLVIENHVQNMKIEKVTYEVQIGLLEHKHKLLENELKGLDEVHREVAVKENDLRAKGEIDEFHREQIFTKYVNTEQMLTSFKESVGRFKTALASINVRESLVTNEEQQQTFYQTYNNFLRDIFEINCGIEFLKGVSQIDHHLDKHKEVNSALKDEILECERKCENAKNKRNSLMITCNEKSSKLKDENRKLMKTILNYDQRKKELKDHQRYLNEMSNNCLEKKNTTSKTLEHSQVENLRLKEKFQKLKDDNNRTQSENAKLVAMIEELKREDLQIIAEIERKTQLLENKNQEIADLTDQSKMAKDEFEKNSSKLQKISKVLEEMKTKYFDLLVIRDIEEQNLLNAQKNFNDIKMTVAEDEQKNSALEKLLLELSVKEDELADETSLKEEESLQQIKYIELNKQKLDEVIEQKNQEITSLKLQHVQMEALNKCLEDELSYTTEEIRTVKELLAAAEILDAEQKKKLAELNEKGETLSVKLEILITGLNELKAERTELENLFNNPPADQIKLVSNKKTAENGQPKKKFKT